MTSILQGALALATATGLGTLSVAGTGEWSTLDAEATKLAATVGQTPSGPTVGALIRSSFDFSSDDLFEVDDGGTLEDLQGLRFQDARLWAQGNVGDLNWRLSFDFAESNGQPNLAGNTTADGLGDADLQDAYAQWQCAEALRITWGQFICPPLRSTLNREDRLLFIDRTVLGGRFEVWQPGIALDGQMEAFRWKLAAQNGADGTAEDIGITARGEYDIGAGAWQYEGAYDAADGTNATIGVAWFDEGQLDDGSMLVVDAQATFGEFSAQAELADLDDDLAPMMFNVTEGNTPFSVTGGYMIRPQEWEVALRFQDLDDDLDTTILGAGVNYYQAGHAAKWQLNISQYDDDNDDGLIFQLGLTVGTDA